MSMNKFTKGELKVIAETDHVQCGDAAAMARIILDGMYIEPTPNEMLCDFTKLITGLSWLENWLSKLMKAAAPPCSPGQGRQYWLTMSPPVNGLPSPCPISAQKRSGVVPVRPKCSIRKRISAGLKRRLSGIAPLPGSTWR